MIEKSPSKNGILTKIKDYFVEEESSQVASSSSSNFSSQPKQPQYQEGQHSVRQTQAFVPSSPPTSSSEVIITEKDRKWFSDLLQKAVDKEDENNVYLCYIDQIERLKPILSVNSTPDQIKLVAKTTLNITPEAFEMSKEYVNRVLGKLKDSLLTDSKEILEKYGNIKKYKEDVKNIDDNIQQSEKKILEFENSIQMEKKRIEESKSKRYSLDNEFIKCESD